MNYRNSILFFLLMLSAFISQLKAQDLPPSCVNSKERYGIHSTAPGTSVVWTVSGGTIISDFNDSIDIQWGNTPGIKTISYRTVNLNGCSSADTTQPVMLYAPSTNLGPNKDFCTGDSAELDAGNGFKNYRWSDGSINRNFTAKTSGIYWVEVTDDIGCTYRDSITITSLQLPKVNIGRDTAICPEQSVLLDAGNLGSTFQWSSGENSQTKYAYMGDGKIWVKVTDINGCVGSDTIEILKCNLGQLFIPNAFTPGSGVTNESWYIGGYDKFPNMVVKVYDRWGRLVYTSERGYSKPWDGTSKGKPLPMDTYYYIISLGDGSKEMVGSVTIIR